jgi:hypothetical protein
MIISVSGKIGSGKDTVAKIIQDATPYYNWEVKKFAGKLKYVATLLSGIPMEKWEDQEFKQTEMSPEWGMTYREFLQRIGTEAMRNGLHTDTWVNALFADYNESESNWIVTDTRFPNEIDMIQRLGGQVWRVRRGQDPFWLTRYRTRGKEPHSIHPSEWMWAKSEFDRIIHNDATLNELQDKVVSLVVNYA